jgi:hypothetical protein
MSSLTLAIHPIRNKDSQSSKNEDKLREGHLPVIPRSSEDKGRKMCGNTLIWDCKAVKEVTSYIIVPIEFLARTRAVVRGSPTFLLYIRPDTEARLADFSMEILGVKS